MKAILMSIRPEWVAKILNGKKTIEIRKTMPKCKLPIDVYIYCTKDKNKNLYMSMFHGNYQVAKNIDHKHHILNGKVVAKFTLNKVEEINSCEVPFTFEQTITDFYTDTFNDMDDLLKASCLDYYSLEQYLKYSHSGYAWHIDNLVPFDKPKELKEFYKLGAWKVYEEQLDSSYMKRAEQEIMKSLGQVLTRAPESYCYVEI